MEVMFRVALPVFVRVKDWAEEMLPTPVAGKVRLVGLKLTAGAAGLVPERVMVCGELDALSAILIVAVFVPAAEGMNWTLRLQEA
jgi:hypothetical protein